MSSTHRRQRVEMEKHKNFYKRKSHPPCKLGKIPWGDLRPQIVVDYVISKANVRLAVLKKLAEVSASTKIQIFKATIRPLMLWENALSFCKKGLTLV